MRTNIWNRFWRDDKGKIALWQKPNLPLSSWLVSTLAMQVFTHGLVNKFLGILAFGSIFTWAYLETRYGISYFRKLLGVIVLVMTVIAKI